MVAVSELVSGLDAELVRLGYKASTMVWYRGCWRRLERFFASRGVREFSLDLAMTWVDQVCGGFFDKEQVGALKPSDVYLFRVARMLDDFAVHGAVLRRCCRTVGKLTADQADTLARFAGVAAGQWLRRINGAGLWHGGRGVPRVHQQVWWSGRPGRRGHRRVRGHSGRLPGARPWSTNCAPYGRCRGSPATG